MTINILHNLKNRKRTKKEKTNDSISKDFNGTENYRKEIIPLIIASVIRNEIDYTYSICETRSMRIELCAVFLESDNAAPIIQRRKEFSPIQETGKCMYCSIVFCLKR